MSDNKRKSTFAILKSDIRNGRVKIYKCNEKIEYHIYKKNNTNNLIYIPKPILWSIIVCEKEHVVKNVKKGFEVIGIRYTEKELIKYLNENQERVYHKAVFK
jgi:hypothetical protein